jgi:hypothetical protein
MGVDYRIETELVVRKSTAPRRDRQPVGPRRLN